MPDRFEQRPSVLEAVRLITPTVELEKFRRKVHRIGSIAVGFKDTAALRHLPVFDTDEAEDQEPIHQHLGIGNLTVYEGELSYTHFTRRVLPQENLKREMFRVLERFSGANEAADTKRSEDRLPETLSRIGQNYGATDPSELSLPIIDLKPIETGTGTQYVLVTDEKSTAMLHEMDDAIYFAVRSTGPGAQLCRTTTVGHEEGIAFAELPAAINSERQDFFERWVADCLSENPLTLLAGPVDWQYGPSR